MRLFGRLRTQLILSHLIAIAFTLVAMVAAVVLLAGSWFAHQQSGLSEPTQQARTVAQVISPLVGQANTTADLNVVLRDLARGDLAVPVGAPWTPPDVSAAARSRGTFSDVAYIVVVSPDGRPLASSDPAGNRFSPLESREWESLTREVIGSDSDPGQWVWIAPSGQPAALGAYPVVDDHGKPVAVVLVATHTAPVPAADFNFWRGLAVIGTASAAVLTAASLFALLSASIVSYFLSRRLVARLEGLGRGAEELAAGNLARRVEEGPDDEVGQLARRFNAMAERMAATVAELATARDNAEAALRAKRDLVANVSHELRTPLALIRSHVEALQMPRADVSNAPSDPLQRDYLAIVERETDNLSHLVDDLFALSTAEAGTLPLNLEPVALAEVIAEVAGSVQTVARRERKLTVVTAVPPDLPEVRADRRRVMQVLANLTRNALRHTPEGGLIALRAERQDGGVVVSVEDTGEGIPPERLTHVFERFYRGDDARDRASGGAGLGLAIVREFVEAMAGEVAVESVVGEGSRFSFRLPIAPESHGAATTVPCDRRPMHPSSVDQLPSAIGASRKGMTVERNAGDEKML